MTARGLHCHENALGSNDDHGLRAGGWVARWPAAGSLILLASEGAGTASLQQCMLEVWCGDGLFDMKAMIIASCIDLYRQPVCKQTKCVVADVLRPAFTMLTTCVRSADGFSMP